MPMRMKLTGSGVGAGCASASMCTSISTQYRFSAVSAFVVDAATQSVNSDLDKHGSIDQYKHDSKDY